jgi:Holliday junction resolvase RusA-like endonuclease
MGISEKQYQAMLKSNDQVGVISDPGKVTIDYSQVQRQAGSLGQATAQALESPLPANLVAQSLVLPLPPSTNANWDHYSARTVLSEESRNYRANVRLLANIARVRPFDGDVAVYVHVYRSRQRGDLDNFAKALCDSLNGIAYFDDDQITELHMFRHEDPNDHSVVEF